MPPASPLTRVQDVASRHHQLAERPAAGAAGGGGAQLPQHRRIVAGAAGLGVHVRAGGPGRGPPAAQSAGQRLPSDLPAAPAQPWVSRGELGAAAGRTDRELGALPDRCRRPHGRALAPGRHGKRAGVAGPECRRRGVRPAALPDIHGGRLPEFYRSLLKPGAERSQLGEWPASASEF